MRRWIAGRKHHWTWWNLDLNLRRAVKMAHLHLHVQATGYALLISLLERNREDFDQFLVFWRCFLSPQGLMYWQLLRHGEEVRAGRRCFTPIAAQGVLPHPLLNPAPAPQGSATLCRAACVTAPLRSHECRRRPCAAYVGGRVLCGTWPAACYVVLAYVVPPYVVLSHVVLPYEHPSSSDPRTSSSLCVVCLTDQAQSGDSQQRDGRGPGHRLRAAAGRQGASSQLNLEVAACRLLDRSRAGVCFLTSRHASPHALCAGALARHR